MTDTPAGETPARDTPARETPTYEAAREELIGVVQRLEAGGIPLDESIRLWERGEELARICQQRLDGARARLDAVIAPATGASTGGSTGG